MRIAVQAVVVGGASYPATVEEHAMTCTMDGFRPALLPAIVRNELNAQELPLPHGATPFATAGGCNSQSSWRCLRSARPSPELLTRSEASEPGGGAGTPPPATRRPAGPAYPVP